MSDDDVCGVCKGSGEIEAYLPHPNGDPEYGDYVTVNCYACGGTGDACDQTKT